MSLSFFNDFTVCIKSLKTGLSMFVSSGQEVLLLPKAYFIANIKVCTTYKYLSYRWCPIFTVFNNPDGLCMLQELHVE